MATEALHLQRALAGLLRPCPFCGGAARLEISPWTDESVRIACGNQACGVTPRTEYLLLTFADELCAAWNARPPTQGGSVKRALPARSTQGGAAPASSP